MVTPFTRNDLITGRYDILSRGRWANADLYLFERNQQKWIIKDFLPCPPMVRKTWGRMIAKREYLAFERLKGIKGIPDAPFLLDEYAVCYEFISGKTLKETPPESISDDYFFLLEELVEKMHAENLVHLDIRNRRNILVTDDGKPALLDFQTSLNLKRIPKFLHSLLKDIDYSGVYKNWNRVKPQLLDSKRKARLAALNKKRSLWLFKGYPKPIKGDRREE